MIPYEILIRGNDQGEFQGAHAIDSPGANPRKLTKQDLKDIAPAINEASLALESAGSAALAALESTHAEALAAKDTTHAADIAAKGTEIATLTAERDQLAAFRSEFEARFKEAIQDGDVVAYEYVAKEFVKPAVDRLKAEKLAKAKALRDEAKQLEDEAK